MKEWHPAIHHGCSPQAVLPDTAFPRPWVNAGKMEKQGLEHCTRSPSLIYYSHHYHRLTFRKPRPQSRQHQSRLVWLYRGFFLTLVTCFALHLPCASAVVHTVGADSKTLIKTPCSTCPSACSCSPTYDGRGCVLDCASARLTEIPEEYTIPDPALIREM